MQSPKSGDIPPDLVLSSVLRHLRRAGISLAYPKADVYHADLPERQVKGHTEADEMDLLSRVRLFQPLMPDEMRRIAHAANRSYMRFVNSHSKASCASGRN